MIKASELQAKVDALTEIATTTSINVEKVRVEVKALKDSLGDATLPPEAEAAIGRLETALNELKAGVTGVDEINPDAAPPA